MSVLDQRQNDLQDQFNKLGSNSRFHSDVAKRFPFLNRDELNKIAFEYYTFQFGIIETPHMFEHYVDFGTSEETTLIIKKYIYAN